MASQGKEDRPVDHNLVYRSGASWVPQPCSPEEGVSHRCFCAEGHTLKNSHLQRPQLPVRGPGSVPAAAGAGGWEQVEPPAVTKGG